MSLEEELGPKSNWVMLNPSSCLHRPNWTTIYRVKQLPRTSTILLSKLIHNDGQGGGEGVIVKKVSNLERPPHDPEIEIEILSELNHPNIIKLLGYFRPPTHSNFYLILPFYKLTLSDLLNLNDPYLFKPTTKDVSKDGTATQKFTKPKNEENLLSKNFYRLTRRIFRCLATGLNFLHDRGISRDLNPNNVGLGRNFEPVIFDFGTAHRSNRQSKDHPSDQGYLGEGDYPEKLDFELGTMPYRAPELLFGSQCYSPIGIDLWSLGVILTDFFRPYGFMGLSDNEVGSLPYNGFNMTQISNNYGGQSNVFDWYCSVDSYGAGDGSIGSEGKSPGKFKRKSLFLADFGDIGLVGSIFKVLGTPDLESWPEAKDLPDFSKLEFHSFEPKDMNELLSYLPKDRNKKKDDDGMNKEEHKEEEEEGEDESKLIIELISKLLVYSESKRIRTDEVLNHPWLKKNRTGIKTDVRTEGDGDDDEDEEGLFIRIMEDLA